MFEDGPEYKERLGKPFVPPTVTLKEVHDAVPKHLLRKNPWLSSYYCVRDVVCCVAIFYYGFSIERILESNFGGFVPLSAAWQVHLARATLWLVYWWFQGLSFASFFCIAHELGHQTLYDNRYVNDTLGYFFHSFIMAPFFAWKATHNAHHKTVASIERDENYVPYERNEYPLPPKERASTADYLEVFDETPILTMGRMLVMQGAGWWLYMTMNAMGSKRYPKGTNFFSPYSQIFRPDQSISNTRFSVMLTYLHHSDPTIPHYRKDEWSWVRGAAATVDRPLLGWAGRFFLHNVSHDHVAHHFFSCAPFYSQPEITKHVRQVLKGDYNYDSTNTFYALYRSFTQCVYVDDDESIVFYRNKYGQSFREVAKKELKQINEHWNPEVQDCGTKTVAE
ncbi:delta-12-fatty acid desaturase [Daedalea quercina L-15889]|uniref:Delta-12-fatty acid desaturase n=1 Tax=Daedalea quercina L-15889 TaxID=1314783 RepID=A0A165N6S5_9APHY|nr:delta-12-fatty acid desaturase [Daedalea quercina L-15889]